MILANFQVCMIDTSHFSCERNSELDLRALLWHLQLGVVEKAETPKVYTPCLREFFLKSSLNSRHFGSQVSLRLSFQDTQGVMTLIFVQKLKSLKTLPKYLIKIFLSKLTVFSGKKSQKIGIFARKINQTLKNSVFWVKFQISGMKI